MNKHLLAVALSAAFVTACGGSDSGSVVAAPVSGGSSQTGVASEVGSGEVGSGETESNTDALIAEDAAEASNTSEGVSVEDAAETTDTPEVVVVQDTAQTTDTSAVVVVEETTDTSEVVVDEDTAGTTGSAVAEDPVQVTDTIDNNNEEADAFAVPPPQGLLATAQPTFSWPAVANAEQYKIVVKDAGGSGYERTLDPMAANCQTGEGTCSATTSLAYHDNDLTWHVESTVDGASGPVSDSYNITTPLSENLQPIKSSDGGCEAWASVAYGKYVVLNNSWNSRSINDPNWSQLINVTENANGTISPAWAYDWRGQFDGDEIEVKAYPEVLYGPKLGTHVSGTKEETGLPEQVSQLPEFVVSYDYSETGNAERNVALESFFHDSDDIRGPCDDHDNRVYEMMIWVNNPSIRTPGKLALTGVMVDNQLWNVYIKPDSNKHYIAFTAQNPTTSGTLNWKRFVDWTRDWTAANAEERQIDVLDPSFYMGAIEIGTEMWWGEGTFTLNKFEVTF